MHRAGAAGKLKGSGLPADLGRFTTWLTVRPKPSVQRTVSFLGTTLPRAKTTVPLILSLRVKVWASSVIEMSDIRSVFCAMVSPFFRFSNSSAPAHVRPPDFAFPLQLFVKHLRYGPAPIVPGAGGLESTQGQIPKNPRRRSENSQRD